MARYCFERTDHSSIPHDGGETTSDQFTYRVSDGKGGVDTAIARISINPVNDEPVANNDFFTVNEGQVLNVGPAGVLSNDSDADLDALTAALVEPPQNGSLQLDADGSFRYTHDGSETRADHFTYRASDGNGGSSIAQVTLNINAVNDAPTVRDDRYSVSAGGTLTVAAPGLLANDSDPDGGPLRRRSASRSNPWNAEPECRRVVLLSQSNCVDRGHVYLSCFRRPNSKHDRSSFHHDPAKRHAR